MYVIEELCKDLFEMIGVVSEMYIFLRILVKGKEYVDFFDVFLEIGDLFLSEISFCLCD